MEKFPIKIIKQNFQTPGIWNAILAGLIIAGVFCAGTYIFAYTYNPGDTLNPTCSPTDADCITPPAIYSFGANNFSGTGSFTTTGAISGGAIVGTSITGTSLSLGSGSFTTTGTINSGTVAFDSTDFNTKLGYQAGQNIITGAIYNTFVGYNTGKGGIPGSALADYNTAIGSYALYSNTVGADNTAVGSNALYSNVGGIENTAVGSHALYSGADSVYNTAVGSDALYSNTYGQSNTAVGNRVLHNNIYGMDNTAVGTDALYGNTTGGSNTAIGVNALISNITGDGNVAIGYLAGYRANSSNAFYLHNAELATNALEKTNSLMYGTFNTSPASQTLAINAGTVKMPYLTGGTGVAVTADSNTGQLYATLSSLRYKHDIESLSENWTAILQTQPKSFKYNGSGQSDIGYIAEDFDTLGLTDLVLYDKEGNPNSIKYDRIALYTTELLKQQQIDINGLKQRLGIATSDIAIIPAGALGSGEVSEIVEPTILGRVADVLASLGVSIKDGVASIANLASEKFSADNLTAKTARMDKIEMVDSATGDIYCTWVENGEWQKVKGDCASVAVAAATAENPSSSQILFTHPNFAEQNLGGQGDKNLGGQDAQIPNPNQTPSSNSQTTTETTTTTPETTPETTPTPAPETALSTSIDQVSQQLNDLSQQLAQQQEATQQTLQQTQQAAEKAQKEAEKAQKQAEKVQEQVQQSQESASEETPEETPPSPLAEESAQAENPAGAAADLIQSAASSLLNGVLELMRWVIGFI